MKLYAIKSPSGKLLPDTVATNRAKAWDEAFYKNYLQQHQFSMDVARTARYHGWKCVEVKITEITDLT